MNKFVDVEITRSIFGAGLFDTIYPVGIVLAFKNDFDPNELWTGTVWERYAEGKTLVGVDEEDPDFGTIESEGGEKSHKLTIAELPAHTHPITEGYYSVQGALAAGAVTYGAKTYGPSAAICAQSTGGNGSHNNLQPYVTVYYWVRKS